MINRSPDELLPKFLKKDMIFRLRKTANCRKYVCTGLVLKICRENGFKYIAEENRDKILVPCDHPAGEMILPPDKPVYLL
ncbi:MAG: hypothetical protein EBW87_03600 [Burkholderiaceae bacterium]|nr:hypothetical protein [Burkholderiaceae bacterium]